MSEPPIGSKDAPIPQGCWEHTGSHGSVRDYPDAAVEHPDGRILIRLFDKWFFKDECKQVWP